MSEVSEDDALIAEAQIGEDARIFVESDLGQVMLGMAKQDAQQAKDKLALVNPDDKLKIIELQKEISNCERFNQYLAELVSRGNNAFEVLKQRKNDS